MIPRRLDTRYIAYLFLTLPFVLGTLPDSTRFRVANSAEPSDGSRTAESNESIERWVDELNSDTYTVRRRAAAALIRTGLVAEHALENAALSADLEIQLQAERILAIVVENALEKRIAAFENDIDGSGGITLPGWSRAADRLGDGIDSRKMFSKMYRAENALLNEYARDPKASASVFELRLRAIHEGLSSKRTSPVHYRFNRSHAALRSSVRALLLVGSDPAVPIGNDSVEQFDQLLQQAWSAGNPQSTVKDFGGDDCLSDWIAVRSTTDTLKLQHLHLGMVFGVKSAVGIAERVLGSRTLGKQAISANHHRIAILCIARFGDENHIALLEPLLENATRVAYNQRIVNKQRVRVETQLRDIALAALVHITDQEGNYYHLIAKAVTEPYEYRPNSVFFQNNSDRENALAKWAVWREEHAVQDQQD